MKWFELIFELVQVINVFVKVDFYIGFFFIFDGMIKVCGMGIKYYKVVFICEYRYISQIVYCIEVQFKFINFFCFLNFCCFIEFCYVYKVVIFKICIVVYL